MVHFSSRSREYPTGKDPQKQTHHPPTSMGEHCYVRGGKMNDKDGPICVLLSEAELEIQQW